MLRGRRGSLQGCDASVLLAGPDTEMTAIPNLSLRGFNIIEKAKAALCWK
jgi:peroxidase